MPQEAITPAQALVAAGHRSIYGFRHEMFSGDADFFNGYRRDACPRCNGGNVARAGFDRSGVQRCRCDDCRRTFTPMTGTIFEDHKLPLPAWSDFVLQTLSFESMSAMTREDRRADTTPPYWMAKLFAVLEGVQSGTVLTGKAWIDETFWPVAAKDAVRRSDGKLPRGLSKNQICIGVGVDESGRSLFIREGFGKTSKKRTWAAFGPHIAPGTTLIHDMEKAHGVLVEKLSLTSEVYNARLLKGIPDKLNPLQPVNRLCFLLKRFLGAHSGFNRNDMQGYLDLFSVAMNPPEDKLEKVANVLDRAMRCPKTIRFREFYGKKPSSDAC
jgi:hypothetical protein